jgi:hypothetical protein
MGRGDNQGMDFDVSAQESGVNRSTIHLKGRKIFPEWVVRPELLSGYECEIFVFHQTVANSVKGLLLG